MARPRPQTDLSFGQAPLRSTVQGAGRNQVFVAPLPRQTSAQVLAKNLAQFSNVLGQFSNVQRQRAEEDALSLTTDELIDQIDKKGKEFGIMDKIGYEKQFEETVYSRYFDLELKPMFSQFSQEIENQGVERLSGLDSFEDYVNKGLDGINERALEKINDRPFMKNVHNILFGQARTNFFVKESASYNARRQAYLKDASVESFDINFPDVSGLPAKEAAEKVQNHIVAFEAVFEKNGIAEAGKRKSILYSGAKKKIQALAMDGDFPAARSVLKSLDAIKVNKHSIFKGASGSLFREELEDFILSEEKAQTSGNLAADKAAVEAMILEIKDQVARQDTDTLEAPPSFFSEEFFELERFEDVEAKYIRTKQAELLENEESVLNHPKIDGSPTRLALYRERLENYMEEREAGITAKMEPLLSDGDAGFQLDTYVKDYTILEAIPQEEYPGAYVPVPLSIEQRLKYQSSNVPLPTVLSPAVQNVMDTVKRKHVDNFNKLMRRKGRQLVIEEPDEAERELQLSAYAEKFAKATLERIRKDLKDDLEKRNLKVSSISAPPSITQTELQQKTASLSFEGMSPKEAEEAESAARSSLLESSETFPSTGGKKPEPDVSIKKNFDWGDTGSFLGSKNNFEKNDYLKYNALKQETQNKGLFVNRPNKISEFFENRKSILMNSDFAAENLAIIQEGSIYRGVLHEGGIGYKVSMDEIASKKAELNALFVETGLTEQQAQDRVVNLGGRNYYVGNIVKNRWNDAPILKWSTIMAYNDKKSKGHSTALKTLKSIVDLNGISSIEDLIKAQTKIYNKNTNPSNPSE
jgi:hypothetical protein